MTSTKPPIGNTICNGKYRVVETLRDGIAQGLHRGVSTRDPEHQVLITTLFSSERLTVEKVRGSLVASAPGRLPLEAVTFFDLRDNGNGNHGGYQRRFLALVEQLPPGDWVGRMLGKPIGSSDAITLGLSAGLLLNQAAENGALMTGVRPEYLWAERRPDGNLFATGASDRYQNFLLHTGGSSSLPATLLPRTYLAPELHRQAPATTASLTFTLATMMAEWTTGEYPFPDAWAASSISALLRGEHIPLEIPERLAHLLHLGMTPAPADRPSLPAFLAALEALSEEELTS